MESIYVAPDGKEPLYRRTFPIATQGEYIERWKQMLRVLVDMPEHDRKRHFNMGVWGQLTECGTIGCAAGHAGLDAWFRDQGFQMNFRYENPRPESSSLSEAEWIQAFAFSEISRAEYFFGNYGSEKILFDGTPRPVETVIEEVRQVIAYLERGGDPNASPDREEP